MVTGIMRVSEDAHMCRYGRLVCVLLSYMSDTTLDALLALSRDRLERVAPHELAAAVSNGAVVVDVRDSAQRAEQGGLPGSHVIDLTVLEWRLAPSSDSRTVELPPDQRVILVCSDGCSSSLAAARLQDLGVKGATDLQGGYRAWATSRRSM
jgi:rhodanese-related sulfurtransferase